MDTSKLINILDNILPDLKDCYEGKPSSISVRPMDFQTVDKVIKFNDKILKHPKHFALNENSILVYFSPMEKDLDISLEYYYKKDIFVIHCNSSRITVSDLSIKLNWRNSRRVFDYITQQLLLLINSAIYKY